MPRSVRYQYEGAVYHVMCRGNNGQEIFRTDAGRRLFLETLGEVCEQTGWRIHAYVLMSNHYHLLLETPEANLVAGMKWFQGTYTQRFNAMFKCRGHLYQGRYKALPVDMDGDSGYFAEVGQYIHLNPFRAGLAGGGCPVALEAYRWSSYPAYSGKVRKPPAWLYRDRLLSASGVASDRPGWTKAYAVKVMSRMLGEEGDATELARDRVEKQLRWGWFVGSELFRKHLGALIEGTSDNLRGAQRAAHDEAEAERILREALVLLELSEEELLTMKNSALEKKAIAWLIRTKTTVTVTWLSERLGMGHRTGVSRVIAQFRDGKDPEIEEFRSKILQITG